MNLVQSGFLAIGEREPLVEFYDVSPLFNRLHDLLEPKIEARGRTGASLELLEKKETSVNLFALFEQEFGRPLSPLEYEKIVSWLDGEGYREELIREALAEAVLSGKFNFKYIDRILFEWQKLNIRTVQELHQHREQFRNRIPSAQGRGGSVHAAVKGRERGGPGPGQGSGGGERGTTERENKYEAFYRIYNNHQQG
jgi:DNA replication protein